MTATATELNINQTYEELKRLIHHLVIKFQSRYGGDFDELLSEAHWHFMRACRTYNPRKKAKIITHVYNRVWYGLKSTLSKNSPLRYGPRDIRRKDLPLESLPHPDTQSRLARLLERVSDDARTVIRLALPTEGTTGQARRGRVIHTLCDCGWSVGEVLTSFEEIREALAG